MGKKVRFVLLCLEPLELFVYLLIVLFELGQNDTRQLHYTKNYLFRSHTLIRTLLPVNSMTMVHHLSIRKLPEHTPHLISRLVVAIPARFGIGVRTREDRDGRVRAGKGLFGVRVVSFVHEQVFELGVKFIHLIIALSKD